MGHGASYPGLCDIHLEREAACTIQVHGMTLQPHSESRLRLHQCPGLASVRDGRKHRKNVPQSCFTRTETQESRRFRSGSATVIATSKERVARRLDATTELKLNSVKVIFCFYTILIAAVTGELELLCRARAKAP